MPDASIDISFIHRVRHTRGVFDPANPTLAQLMISTASETPRALVLIDAGLVHSSPSLVQQIRTWFAAMGGRVQLANLYEVPGGERAKNEASIVDAMLERIRDAHLCRHSYVVAVGGGAMLDAAGFASAIAHRGVRLIRVPTTTLAQADSGVGVKNSVNRFGIKNFLGTFQVPWAVVNDIDLLHTLSLRDWRCGFAEVIKVALLKDPALLDQTTRLAPQVIARDLAASQPLLERCADLHLQHIATGGDPFETSHSRPLDFGHWSAHKLEQLSQFELRHGEAVAMGIHLDGAYCLAAGLLPASDYAAIRGALIALGFELNHPAMGDPARLLQGLEEFREHLGGQLTITLLRSIGQPLDVHDVDIDLMQQVIRRVSQTQGAAALPV